MHKVSDPSDARYGQHLTAAEARSFMQPAKQTVTAVKDWLRSHDVVRFETANSACVSVRISIAKAQELLGTKYHLYQHVSGQLAYGTEEWSLPLHLHEHVDSIHPTNAFFARHRRSTAFIDASRKPRLDRRWDPAVPPSGLGGKGIPTFEEMAMVDRTERGHMDVPALEDLPNTFGPTQACNELATSPLCLQTLYGTLRYRPRAPDKVRIGLVNYLEQVNNQSDIEIFLQRYRPDAAGAGHKIKTEIIHGGSNHQGALNDDQAANRVALEGNLNAQTIIGLAHPIGVTAYNVGGRGPQDTGSTDAADNRNEPYLQWLEHVLALSDADLPKVITTSYADVEQSVPQWYARRVCQGFAQLSARGVTVLFASGDEGVGLDGQCYSKGKEKKAMFLPTFPASCPYVTVVGGTRNLDPEIAGFDVRRGFVAGGGFSNYFKRPGYQDVAVTAYLDKIGSMHDGLFNRNGRAYPDIAMRAYHYIEVWNGTAHIIDGTSASAPAAAAIIALVNDALAAEGKPSLGWLNPWLYSEGFHGFRDVVGGSIVGCNTSGFPALEGWDAATGWGSPVSAALFRDPSALR